MANGTWTTESVSHNEEISIRQGDGPIRVYFRVISGSSTLDVETSSDGFVNDIVDIVTGLATGSVQAVNNTATKTLLGHKIRPVLSDPSAEVEIKISRYS